MGVTNRPKPLNKTAIKDQRNESDKWQLSQQQKYKETERPEEKKQ